MNDKQILGLDIGMKRTGIARASAVARLAEPLISVHTSELQPALEKMIDIDSVGVIVIGLPRSLEGEDTAQTAWVRKWVEDAKPKLAATLYWQDEALTTALAEAKAATYKKPKDVDSLAAAAILQDFLDTPEAERVVC